MADIRNNILDTIGNTPLVRLNKVAQGVDAELVAKLEFFNPGGSVKDRIGIAMIEDAERKGTLKPGGTIVEGTSGNTGMGLAIAAAIKGYQCVFVIPDKMSQEKVRNLRAFGAKVVVTPTAVEPDDPRSYYMVSRRLAREIPNAAYMNQYDNLSNREAHYRTTGPELWKQLDGKFDAFVAGIGTGGTITGTAMYLKEKNKNIQIVGADPIGSILHDFFKTGEKTVGYPYKVEGIGEDIIPQNIDFKFCDEIVQVNDKESFQMTRRLLLEEGIFSGISSGSAVVAAIKYARKLGGKKRIVVLLPDSGDRYLSKVYDDNWMRENGFLEGGLGTVADLIAQVKPPAREAIVTASPGDQIEKIIRLMRQKGISQLPVLKGLEVLGLVAENDLLNALFSGKLKNDDKIESIVEDKFVKVVMSDDVERLSQSMSAGLTPIVVENGELVSIITKIDLITYLGNRKK
ncbi:MAG: cystathionine beta-synthase [Deltaproteobacteria bacterium]|nr:cystathionine beta-synthase [Deltaproteobacteria bacterium]